MTRRRTLLVVLVALLAVVGVVLGLTLGGDSGRSPAAGGSSVAGTDAPGAPATPAAQPAPPAGIGCSADDGLLVRRLASGSTWALCWTIESTRGFVLSDVWFKGAHDAGYHQVLAELALGQLNVPYDTGETVYNDITSYGFGNEHLQKLSDRECPDGSLLDFHQNWPTTDDAGQTVTHDRTIPAMCVTEQSAALAYRSHEQSPDDEADAPLFTGSGYTLDLRTISKVDWYEYVEDFQLTDTGTISVNLGATGDVSPDDFGGSDYADKGWPIGTGPDEDYAASHWHNALWKVKFAIDGSTQQYVERSQTTFTGTKSKTGDKAPIQTTKRTRIQHATSVGSTAQIQAADPDTPADLTWYRVVAPDKKNSDGHPKSYEIDFDKEQTYDANPITQPQLTFTLDKDCRVFASNNLSIDPSCAGESYLDYVTDDADAKLVNPVVWVNSGFHHIVRDEDQSPMPTHWQSFSLVPRDFSAQSPITPPGRVCINGDPGGELHTACVPPTALTPPAVSGTPQKGQTLTASDGTWSQWRTDATVPSRQMLLFSYQWYRDDTPVDGATAKTYQPVDADVGHRLSVVVTATDNVCPKVDPDDGCVGQGGLDADGKPFQGHARSAAVTVGK